MGPESDQEIDRHRFSDLVEKNKVDNSIGSVHTTSLKMSPKLKQQESYLHKAGLL